MNVLSRAALGGERPRRGVVIQSVGRLTVTASAGELISLHGPANDINLGGGFCEALAG